MKKINRRNFISNTSLFFGLLTTCPINLIAKPLNNESEKLPETLVKGKIITGDKGIVAIPISDGRRIFQSDEKGEFSFHTDQPFVFFNYPSGYALNILENGSVDFFRKLDYGREVNEVVFELEPNTFSEENHHFLVIADPQIQNEEEADQFIQESCTDIFETVSSLNDPNLFGIGCGDLVFDRFDLFEKYNEGIRKTQIPFFQVLGNHDINLLARSNEESQKPFHNQYGPAYYSFNRGNKHYMVLSDVFFLGNRQYYGYLDETQLKWVEQDLKTVSPNTQIVVFLHIPIDSSVYKNNVGRDPNKESLVNRDALLTILEAHQVHLISGHVHWNENSVNKKNFEHNQAAISGAWWTGPICYDGTPKGYGVYEAGRRDLFWYYKSVGKPKAHQFRVYSPGSHPDHVEDYCINVWNWDEDWKIYWLEDGIRIGQPRREVALDPLAVELYGGKDKPEKHPWVVPQMNDHMFFFKSKSNITKLAVEVVDRWGNSYQESFENFVSF